MTGRPRTDHTLTGRPTAPPSPERWQVAGVEVTVRRSGRRRTLALQVRGAEVTAYAPLTLPDATIRAFVEVKRDWLRRQVSEQRRPAPAPLQDGAVFAFLGEPLRVQVAEVTAPRREGQTLLVAPERAGGPVAEQVEAWTREAVRPAYTRLVEDYAARLGARERLRTVRVSRARSRWGSCTAAGDIRLHWALSRAPLEVLHYVALHEAAHLLELNHSPRYWQHVARLMPEHERYRRWLREHGEELGMGGGLTPPAAPAAADTD